MNLALAIASLILGLVITACSGSAALGAFTGLACYFGGSLNNDFPTPPRYP